MLTLCAAMLVAALALALVGVLGASAFLYASLIVTLVVAALLPLGALRRLRRT